MNTNTIPLTTSIVDLVDYFKDARAIAANRLAESETDANALIFDFVDGALDEAMKQADSELGYIRNQPQQQAVAYATTDSSGWLQYSSEGAP